MNGKTVRVKKKDSGVLDAKSPSLTSETASGSPSNNSISSSNKRINPTKQKAIGQPKQAQDTVLAKGDKIQQGVEPYSQKQIEWLHGHGVMVEGVDIEIGDFYEKAIAENKRGDKNKLYFGQVSPELAKRIKNETGYDTAGYDFIVNEGTMHHSEKRHGVSSTTLRPVEIPINRKLVALIPEVINNPDTISKEPNQTKGGETIIKFRKKINGYVAYLQVYGKRKGRKNGRLIAKTYYVESSKNNEAGGAVDAETPNRTSENDSTLPSDTIIRTQEEKINATEGKAAGRLMPAEFKIGGAKANVQGIASVQSGKVTVELEDGDLAIADDLKFGNKTQGELYDKAKHFETNAAKTFAAVYEANIPVNDYFLGFTRIHGAARAGTAFEQAVQINEYTAALPSHIQKAAYNAGEKAGVIADDVSMKNATSVRVKTEQLRFNEWLKEHKTEVIAKKNEISERFKEAEANGDVAEMNKQRKEYQALEQWSKETIRDMKAQIGKAVGGVVKSGGEIEVQATDIGAIATDIGANAVKYEEISTLDNLLISTKNLDEAKTAISEIDISNLSITDLNKLLRDSGKISGLSLNEVALLKSDIIKQAGFDNFDWKAIGEEVKGFVNMNINVVELDDKITLFRRGYPNEPSSQYGLGRWWSDKYRTIEEVRNELAVLEEWGNPLTGEYTITVPRGIRVLTGLAASQKAIDELGNVIESRDGGEIQYWLNDISDDWLLN